MARYAPQDAREKVARYSSLAMTLKTTRSSFDPHWKELSDFVRPRRTRFFAADRNRGEKRNANIIDSTGSFASRTLSSGMHAGLTSPARPWFKLSTPDPELAKRPVVKRYLHEATQRMATVFITSNLYTALPTIYSDLGNFGTGAMAVLEDEAEVMRVYNYPLGSYCLGSDARGRVSTFVREYEITVEQLIERFAALENGDIDWSGVSTAVKNLWNQGEYHAAIPITWVTVPNPDFRPRALGPRSFKYSSCYFETGTSEGKLLRESGFNEFPILAPRWETTGEDDYGNDCPGMTALGDIKQLQSMQKKKGQAIGKLVDPPLQAPPSVRTQKTSLLAGEITYVAELANGKGISSLHEVGLNLSHLRDDIGDVRFLIRRAYYEDLFLMLAQSDQVQPITAEEVRERHEEKLLALGPVLERTNDEMLDPLIDRVYAMMERRGLLPEVPQELDGVKLKVEYLSIMAQAQKLVGVVAIDRFMGTALPIIQGFPEARHKIDVLRVLDVYGDALGVDPMILRTDEEAQAAIKQDAQQQQANQVAQNAALMGKAAQSAAAAPMQGDTALSQILDGISRGGGAAA
jgi:hypothetical protein